LYGLTRLLQRVYDEGFKQYIAYLKEHDPEGMAKFGKDIEEIREQKAAENAQRAASKILGPQLSLAPAVKQLCAHAPDAGEQEMVVIKQCLVENPAAQESLDVLTGMLIEKWRADKRRRGN
jgi:hypothetical protein